MRDAIIRVSFVIVVICLVELVVSLGLVNHLVLPLPSKIFLTLGSLLITSTFWIHVAVTSLEVFLAAAISIPLGIITGFLIAKQVLFKNFFGPFVYFLVSVPKSIFLPLFILVLGVGFDQKVIFGVAQAIFVIVINTAAATVNVPKAWVTVGRSCGANSWDLYTKIYIPAMVPMVLEGIRLGIIFIITGVILAEMYAAKNGFGFLISVWADTFNMPFLFAGIVFATALTIIINESIRRYEKKVSTWRK